LETIFEVLIEQKMGVNSGGKGILVKEKKFEKNLMYSCGCK